jgi:acyl-CoA thioesterase FadM
MRELWRGEAGPSDRDASGHLAPPAVLAILGEALAGLAAELGLSNLESARATSALLPRRVDLAILAAPRAGATLVARGGVTAFEEARLEAAVVLADAADGASVAGVAVATDHIETVTARVFPWSTRTAEAARSLRVKLPPEARLGALGAPPAESAPAADADLTTVAQGVFGAAEADPFGRVRVEALLARLLMGSDVGAPRIELRLTVHAYPAPGERFLVQSRDAEGRRRLVDPARGVVRASLEVARG